MQNKQSTLQNNRPETQYRQVVMHSPRDLFAAIGWATLLRSE